MFVLESIGVNEISSTKPLHGLRRPCKGLVDETPKNYTFKNPYRINVFRTLFSFPCDFFLVRLDRKEFGDFSAMHFFLKGDGCIYML